MFEARLKQDGLFQKMVSQLQKTMYQNVLMRCTPTQIAIEAMDEKQKTFVQADLSPDLLFGSYRCDGVKKLRVDLDVLKRMLTNHRSDEMPPPTQRLLLSRDTDAGIESPRDSLKILSERTESVCVYEIALPQEPEEFTVPEEDWQCSVQMPAKKFRSIIQDLDRADYSEASILVTAGGVSISGRSLSSRCTRFIPCSTDTTISTIRPVDEMRLEMIYLVSFAGMAKHAENVVISMKKDAPIWFELPLIQGGTEMREDENHHRVTYYAAPMEQEDCSLPLALPIERQALPGFKARFSVKMFTRMFEAINCITGCYVATIQCHPDDGIHVQRMDSTHVTVVDITMPVEEFESFRCDHQIRLEVNALNVCPSLEALRDDTVLTLTAGDCSESLDIRTLEMRTEHPQSGETTMYEMTRTKDNFEVLLVPTAAELQYSAISMPSVLFQRIVGSLKGDKCFIHVTVDCVVFCATNTSRKISDKKHEGVVFDVTETSENTFSLPWLKTFVKAGWLSSTVVLSIRQDKPLKVGYGVQPCTCDVYLAPRIENDLDTPEALSERVRAAKEMAPITKRAAKKILPLKRKRTPSDSDLVPILAPVKKPAKPRTCRTCKVVKPPSAFFKKDCTALHAHCIDCMVMTLRWKMAAYNEPRTWQSRERVVENRRAVVRCMRASGCERYECPIFFPNKIDNLSEDLQASFSRELPDIGQLVGDYDLVYTFLGRPRETRPSPRRCMFTQRTSKGKISLSSQAAIDKRGINLIGSIAIPEEMMIWTISGYFVGESNFVLSQTSDESCHEFELPIKFGLANSSRAPKIGEYTGSLRVLARRTATSWNPKENPREEPWRSMSWEKRPVLFQSVEEAEILVKRWEERFLANSWLNNHLGLPPELSLRIHQFVAFRPAPAFFFQKGDIWMEVNRATVKLILVARRRSL